ncbi:hypothetical protein [Fervidobacterium sp.]
MVYSCKSSKRGLSFALIFYAVFIFNFIISGQVLAFAETYSDFYGIGYFQPSSVMNKIVLDSGKYIFLPDYVTLLYSFSMNVNPKSPGFLEQGFTVKSNLGSFSPLFHIQDGTVRYSTFGLSYDIGAKLFGNSKKEAIYVLGLSVGVDIESVNLFVGSSSSISEFTNNDFKHFNSVSNMNIYTLFKFLIQMPITNSYFSNILISIAYYLGATAYGPFLPNFELLQEPDLNRSMQGLSLSVMVGNVY